MQSLAFDEYGRPFIILRGKPLFAVPCLGGNLGDENALKPSMRSLFTFDHFYVLQNKRGRVE